MTATVQQYLENWEGEVYRYNEFVAKAPVEVKQYLKELEDDIIHMAATKNVYIVDTESGMAEGYDISTMENYFSYCSLPETVIDFFMILDCDFEFIMDFFLDVEDKWEAAVFQLAEGRYYCNYTSAYRTMTYCYNEFERMINSELYDLAVFGHEQTIREYIYDHEVYVLGNRVGRGFFDVYLEGMEEEFKKSGIEKLVELYKKSITEEVEEPKEIIGVMDIFSTNREINYKEEYNLNKRDLIVDIVEHVENKGTSISNECMPENMIKFKELSGCTEEEIVDIYKLAAEKAEDYKIAYIQYGEKVVLLKNYEEVSKFIDSCGMDLEDLEIGAESNSFAYARIIKCLAEKSEKTEDDYWNEMMDILFSMSEENEDVEEAVKYVLTTPAGIAYTALKTDLHYKYRYYSRDVWSIKEEIKRVYEKMI